MTKISTHKPSHLKALLRKNWILWKRGWCISLLEILVPFLFAFITIAFRQASEPEDLKAKSYLTDQELNVKFDASLNKLLMKDCHADENGGRIALAPPGNTIVNELDAMFSCKYELSVFVNLISI